MKQNNKENMYILNYNKKSSFIKKKPHLYIESYCLIAISNKNCVALQEYRYIQGNRNSINRPEKAMEDLTNYNDIHLFKLLK